MSVTYLAGSQVAAQQIRREFDDLICGQMLLGEVIDPTKVKRVDRVRKAMIRRFRTQLAVRELALLELLDEPVPDDDEMAERVECILNDLVDRALELTDTDTQTARQFDRIRTQTWAPLSGMPRVRHPQCPDDGVAAARKAAEGVRTGRSSVRSAPGRMRVRSTAGPGPETGGVSLS